MHIAGDSPRGVHLETYVAMSAILLGAAETATAEMKDKLLYVSVELNRGKMVLTSAGSSRNLEEQSPARFLILNGRLPPKP